MAEQVILQPQLDPFTEICNRLDKIIELLTPTCVEEISSNTSTFNVSPRYVKIQEKAAQRRMLEGMRPVLVDAFYTKWLVKIEEGI